MRFSHFTFIHIIFHKRSFKSIYWNFLCIHLFFSEKIKFIYAISISKIPFSSTLSYTFLQNPNLFLLHSLFFSSFSYFISFPFPFIFLLKFWCFYFFLFNIEKRKKKKVGLGWAKLSTIIDNGTWWQLAMAFGDDQDVLHSLSNNSIFQ